MDNTVQIKNPKTGLYVRMNKAKGTITGHKKTPGPYKGVPVAKKRQIRSAPKGSPSTASGKAKKAVKSTRKK